jgi:hypothetical protein
MARDYYGPPEPNTFSDLTANSWVASRYVRKQWQSIVECAEWETPHRCRALLYDFELDRTVELSTLARWIITYGLDQPKSPVDLANELAVATDGSYDSVFPIVTDVLTPLIDRGLLSVIDV